MIAGSSASHGNSHRGPCGKVVGGTHAFAPASSFPCQPCSPNGRRPQISKRHRPPGLAGPAGMRCLDPRDSDCNRQKFQRASGLAPCNSGVVPSDDRRLTVLHRREGGPSSIYFAPASQAACDPVAVRRAEHFGHRRRFFALKNAIGGRNVLTRSRPNCAYA